MSMERLCRHSVLWDFFDLGAFILIAAYSYPSSVLLLYCILHLRLENCI